MATKLEIVAGYKVQYPVLRVGNDTDGYINVSATEYEATLSRWADNQLEQEAKDSAKTAADAAFTKDRADGLAKLEALGLLSNQAVAVARKNR